MGTISVGAIVLLISIAAGRSIYKNKKAGNCCGSCSGCAGCSENFRKN